MKKYYVYILKCSDETYYVGITSRINERIIEHQTGFHPESYTNSRRPVELVFYSEFSDVRVAISREKQIKRWSRLKKEALINGEYDELVNLAKKSF
ncbi:MAG: GIY-YIG nuclease family protein [Flavobacteriales bacterium]